MYWEIQRYPVLSIHEPTFICLDFEGASTVSVLFLLSWSTSLGGHCFYKRRGSCAIQRARVQHLI